LRLRASLYRDCSVSAFHQQRFNGLLADDDVTLNSISRYQRLHEVGVLEFAGSPAYAYGYQEHIGAVRVGQKAARRHAGGESDGVSSAPAASWLVRSVKIISEGSGIINGVRELIEGADPDAFQVLEHNLGSAQVLP
jgi:hypothetical protein